VSCQGMCAPSGSKTLANMSEISRHKNVILITMNGEKLGSNLGPNAAKHGRKPCTMTQNKARRTNKIDFLQLPWAQEVWSSNLHAPTIIPSMSVARVSFLRYVLPVDSVGTMY
jgi:hypothetical protein